MPLRLIHILPKPIGILSDDQNLRGVVQKKLSGLRRAGAPKGKTNCIAYCGRNSRQFPVGLFMREMHSIYFYRERQAENQVVFLKKHRKLKSIANCFQFIYYWGYRHASGCVHV
ncbi:hypothetical protein CEXT_542511 [Caerostris extrusa]|uniref:Uncharacterized protein n=1 Tax=Caerostris extrusa TaxID=172846 RepID=A0AAV4P070_CAEEX|nr:hypothetical protein CEXT_542511 [Caerostris extrusa]